MHSEVIREQGISPDRCKPPVADAVAHAIIAKYGGDVGARYLHALCHGARRQEQAGSEKQSSYYGGHAKHTYTHTQQNAGRAQLPHGANPSSSSGTLPAAT